MTHMAPTHLHNPDPPGLVYWTIERTERLKELLGTGMKLRDIGAEIGGLSKSAIAGKIRRLGLAAPRPRLLTEEEKEAILARRREKDKIKKRRKRAEGGPERRPSVKLIRTNSNSNLLRLIHTITGDVAPLQEADIIPHNVALVDLTDHDCRYPYGEGTDITFCGHPKQEKSSYCPAHAALCWKPLAERKVAA